MSKVLRFFYELALEMWHERNRQKALIASKEAAITKAVAHQAAQAKSADSRVTRLVRSAKP